MDPAAAILRPPQDPRQFRQGFIKIVTEKCLSTKPEFIQGVWKINVFARTTSGHRGIRSKKPGLRKGWHTGADC